MSYQAYITRIKELKKHSNADRLQVATLFGNDVIVGLDVEIGDLGIYFPTDGKLSEEYAKENKLTRGMGGYLDDEKRHVTSIRLRGEKSDGLFMPIKSLEKFIDISTLKEGDNVTTLGGKLICEKYIPKGKRNSNPTPKQKGQKKENKDSFPFFEQHIDTAQLAYNTRSFKEGDLVYITLKLHGTSQRTAHTVKKTKSNFIQKLLGFKEKKAWDYVSGTRRVTLDSFDGGFYGSNEFRKQHHDFFVGKLHKGEEVFYEVVGYAKDEQLIMPECDNKKTKDKEFIKQFGEKTRFTYGCGTGQSDIYVYRMTMTNEDGHTVEYPWELVKLRCEEMGVKHCPELEKFIFTTTDDLLERVSKHENGADPIGQTHIREGVIVRIENKKKFTALKQKNFEFKVLEGIIKSEDVLDMEEENATEQE
ncbi:RNA ligase [Bacillus phage vB_BcoS-136]|uniref:RNA ligase n=1 Tax=Bacillus phage vB_BcoS-136 TaxID=2419619 RepID=A0A3G3BVL5_9CAUD|nr:RNA ligase [Bacillus phage vB_BcoS-136]AYP68305.1 RNA ligase [Bacillus phage vB_BcoS-136]